MMRATLGVIAGILAGLVAMMAVSFAGSALFPIVAPPSSGSAIEQAAAAFTHASTGLRLSYVLAWFVGGLVAGVVAKLIAGSGRSAWTAIAIVAVLTAVNIFILPYPLWMLVANLLMPLFGGWIGNRLVAERQDAPAAPANG